MPNSERAGPSPAAAEEVHRLHEAVVEAAPQSRDALGFETQDAVRHDEEPLALVHLEAPPRPETMAIAREGSTG